MSDCERLATLASGREIESYRFGTGDFHLLLIGGVHGNEIEGVELINALLSRFKQSFELNNLTVLIVPNLNPDGVAAVRRQNDNGVDLNRNMPTKDWSPEALKPEYLPGPSAASEIETQVLVKLIDDFSPNFIISMHSFKEAMINTNGDCGAAADVMHQQCDLPVKDDIGYPTPGSLGTYAGWERAIPTITLEVLRDEELTIIIKRILPALIATIEHFNQNKH
ncbi:MAG: DUF2817 domain-containing protein [Bdellovibrionales bacterium]|nr:DUF2817 domain-containing protein [Bdellovibrionales bacterium]MBT3524950.1 DUF2817 domain-containing protein [Bdellovibrionales bacterium]MBT7668578.1 DUF2817 domain-containing protein [Bdellovibrionales bacterium]